MHIAWPLSIHQHGCLVEVLLFHDLGQRPWFVLLVAELGLEAGILDGLLHTVRGEAELGPRGRYHVFLDHDAAEIVGSGV